MTGSGESGVVLSVVIPVLNEQGNIPVLYESLEPVLRAVHLPYEIIFVDDGSRDRSAEEVERLHARNPRVKLISLSRNFGHQIALSAGLEHAGGNAVITMDGDLQHPPELIPTLVEKWREGYAIVYTVRRDSREAGLFKRWSAAMFYRLINLMTKTPIPVGAADFRLLDRIVVDELLKLKEHARFFRGLVSWVGFRQIDVPYTAPPRLAGRSGYSFARMVRFAMDGITSFSSFPLRLATYMGFVVSAVSFLYGVYTVFMGLFSERVIPGWASLVTAVLFLGGVQLIALGIVGEYVGRIYDQVKGRPLYVVQKTVGDVQRADGARRADGEEADGAPTR